MKTLTLISALSISIYCLSQEGSFSKQTDSIVALIDQKSRPEEHFRYLLGLISRDTLGNNLSKITYSQKAGPRQVIETFYLFDGFIVFATKQADSY